MIIFNLGGFLFGVAFILLCVGILPYLENYFNDDIVNLILSLISLPLAVAIEFTGFKPRIFFIPVWVLSLVFIAVQGWTNFGYYSLIIDAALIYGGYRFLTYLGSKIGEKRWQEASIIINELDKTTLSEKEKRDVIVHSFISDASLIIRHEVIEHNLRLLKVVIEEFSDLFTKEKIEAINIFQNNLNVMLKSEKPELKNYDDPGDIYKILVSSLA